MTSITQTAGPAASAARLLPALDLSRSPGPRLAARAQDGTRRIQESTFLSFTVRHHASISEINPADWNHLFEECAEDWGYFRACEIAQSQHFVFSAVAAYRNGKLVAAAPVFRLDYRLDMTLPERMKTIGNWLAKHAPRLTRIPVLGMGSPMTEECPIGIAAELVGDERQQAVKALIHAMEQHAATEGIKILAMKDVTDRDGQWVDEPLTKQGFARMASLPIATLPLPYASFDGYIQSLPSKKRTDIRRKLKNAQGIETELRDNIDDVYDEILELYRATRANRKASYEAFDEVPESYFREVMRLSEEKARVLLCRLGGRLVSFNFFIVEKDKLIGKFIGMDYDVARDRNLYFFNWMEITRYCIENGIKILQTGQTTYSVKVRLGCKLKRSWVYFKYTGAILGPLVRRIAPRFSFEDADPELGSLAGKLDYLAPDA